MEMTLPALVRRGAIDAETAALGWLLVEDRVPLVVTGTAPARSRRRVAEAMLGVDDRTAFVLLGADEHPLAVDELGALLRADVRAGVTIAGPDLRGVLGALERPPHGLAADAVRRLGLVIVVEETSVGDRIVATHYLRPTERDAQGHVQRRPPAVLATWDADADRFDDYAWGITPELADRVDRTQADLEERRRDRAAVLGSVAASVADDADAWAAAARSWLASEPERARAVPHEPARPSPFASGLLDGDDHIH